MRDSVLARIQSQKTCSCLNIETFEVFYSNKKNTYYIKSNFLPFNIFESSNLDQIKEYFLKRSFLFDDKSLIDFLQKLGG